VVLKQIKIAINPYGFANLLTKRKKTIKIAFEKQADQKQLKKN
jgi:hypothetical protein